MHSLPLRLAGSGQTIQTRWYVPADVTPFPRKAGIPRWRAGRRNSRVHLKDFLSPRDLSRSPTRNQQELAGLERHYSYLTRVSLGIPMLASVPPTTMKPPTTPAPSSVETIRPTRGAATNNGPTPGTVKKATPNNTPQTPPKMSPLAPILHSVTGIVITSVLLRPVVMDHD